MLTRALAGRVAAPRPGETDLGPAFVMLGEAGETTELFGRDALIADLVADAAAALAGHGPGARPCCSAIRASARRRSPARSSRSSRELGARVHLGTRAAARLAASRRTPRSRT